MTSNKNQPQILSSKSPIMYRVCSGNCTMARKCVFLWIAITCILGSSFRTWGQTVLVRTFYLNGSDSSTKWKEYQYYESGNGDVYHGYYREWWVDYAHQTVSQFLKLERTYLDGNLTREKYFYADGKPQSDIGYKQGQYHGVYETWYANGQKDTHIDYVDGQIHGLLEYWADSGVMTAYQEWSNGNKNGLDLSWQADGTKYYKRSYFNGLKDGTFTDYVYAGDYRGKLDKIEQYDKGTLVGGRTFTYLTQTDTNIVGTVLVGGEWVKDGEQKLYDFGTGLITDHQFYDQGLRTGEWTTWWFNGALETHGFFADDLETGEWSYYNQEGVLYKRGTYANGLENGRWTFEISPEQFLYDLTYVNGVVNKGKEYTYFNGTTVVATEWEYAGNTKIHRTFYPDGKPHEETTYLTDIKHGRSRWWYASGVLGWEWEFRNGRKNGITKHWDVNGSIQYEGEYLDDALNGWRIRYDDDRNRGTGGFYPNINPIISKEEYKGGTLHGYAYYYEYDSTSGMLTQIDQGTYSGGSRCGLWTTTYPASSNGLTFTSNYGSCPAPPTPPRYPDPEGDGDNQPTVRTLHGHVSDRKTGLPLIGASVSAGGQNTTSDNHGDYNLTLGAATAYTLSFSMAGYSTLSGPLDMEGYQVRTVNARLVPITPNGTPEIIQVEPQSGWLFLSQVPHYSAYLVSIDWNGSTPQKVIFEANGQTTEVPAMGTQVLYTYNVGAPPFNASLDPKGNTIKVTAVEAGGKYSSPFTLYPIILPHPVWGILQGGAASDTSYTLSGIFPDPPLDLAFKESQVPSAIWSLWSAVPAIGGYPLGLKNIQVIVSAEAKPDGTGSIAVGGTGGFAAGGVEANGKVGGKANLKYVRSSGLELTGGEFSLGIDFELHRTDGVLKLIPAAQALQASPVFGKAADWINKSVKAEVVLGAGFAGALKMNRMNDGHYSFIAEPEVSLSLGGKLTAETRLATITFGAGGTAKIIATYPPPMSGPAARAELDLTATLGITVLRYTRQFEGKHTFKYPAAGGAARLAGDFAAASVEGFHPISLTFLDEPAYGRFMPVRGAARMAAQVGAGAQDQLLIQNVFPDAQPVMAMRDGKTAIVYVHFDPSDTVLQGSEINVIYHDGTSYAQPVTALDDTRSEFSPSVAIDANGKVVVAWLRVKDANFSGENLEDMVPLLEVVYASFDPQTSTWSAVTSLTDNDHFDNNPQLHTGLNGELLLSWEDNTSNALIGDATHPTGLHLATWDAGSRTFSGGASLPDGLVNVNQYDLAFDGSRALLAYVQDVDGDFDTLNDSELFTVKYEDNAWGARARISNDQITEASPRLIYRAADTPELIWVHGDDLVRIDDWQAGTHQVIRPDSASMTLTEYKLSSAPGNKLALVWQRSDEIGPDLFYSAYDPASGMWSDDLRLTSSPETERFHHFGLDANGVIGLVYTSVTDEQTGASDLHHLSCPLGVDLKAVGTDLAMMPTNAQPGQAVVLSCLVTNAGAYAAENCTVAFYDGDPNDGGQLIGNAAVTPSTLGGGGTGSATVNWTIPEIPAGHALFVVVDPANAIAEQDEANNVAFRQLQLPDLQITAGRADEPGDGSVNLVATVRNGGLVAASDVKVRCTADDRDLGRVTVGTVLPGQSVEVDFTTWADLQFTNLATAVTFTADPELTIAESNEENNSRVTEVILAADLDNDGLRDTWERYYFGSTDAMPDGDDDEDGFSNAAEFIALTNPKDASSLLDAQAVLPASGGGVNIVWPGSPEVTYRVQYKEAVDSTEWVFLEAVPVYVGGIYTLTDAPLPGANRFYRVVIAVVN